MMRQNYKKIEVRIRGLSPLLMNRLNPESLKSKGRMKMENYSVEDDAEKSVYRADIDGKPQLYIPAECVYSMMIKAAGAYRIRRTAVSSLLAGTMHIEPIEISLGINEYEVDARPVVIQNNRVIKGRAKIPMWAVTFYIVYDSKRLPKGIELLMAGILDDAGTRMGLLDYRPQHHGPFGTFELEAFIADIDGKKIDIVPELEKERSEGKTPAGATIVAETEETEITDLTETSGETKKKPGRPKKQPEAA